MYSLIFRHIWFFLASASGKQFLKKRFFVKLLSTKLILFQPIDNSNPSPEIWREKLNKKKSINIRNMIYFLTKLNIFYILRIMNIWFYNCFNCIAHRSSVTIRALQRIILNVSSYSWPSRSPDTSPIDHVLKIINFCMFKIILRSRTLKNTILTLIVWLS